MRPRVRVFVATDRGSADDVVQALQADGDIVVAGTGGTAAQVAAQVESSGADVVVVDLASDPDRALACIEQIMGFAPRPVVVVSSRTGTRSSVAVEALVAGAVEVVPRSQGWGPAAQAHLRSRVRAVRGVTVVRHPRARLVRPQRPPRTVAPGRVVGLAASTGGPSALATVLAGLEGLRVPILVVQHLHADFVPGLVSWLQGRTRLHVELARHGAGLEPGTVHVGPAGQHLRVGADRRIVLSPSPATLHRPSADELFTALAEHYGSSALGVVLTGMGADGAAGLLALRRAGGLTIAQDRETSAVFGMPEAAITAGAAALVLPVEEIARTVCTAMTPQGRRPTA